MKNIKNRLLSAVLVIVLTIVMLPILNEPVEASTPPPFPSGNIEQRINALRGLFANGSFFSVNGNACSSNHGSCNNCNLGRTMQRLGYPNLQGNVDAWTCAAFARFAWFYVFGHPLEWF